jgi:hypothetical protein
MAQKAGRVVAEKIEGLLWDGYAGLGANNTIYGYRTAPGRNTKTLTTSWATATGAAMLADILDMISKAQADHMYGPYMIYHGIGAGINMGNDFKAESDKSIRQRLLEIEGVAGFRATANLPDNEVLLVQLTADVVQMINGIQPTMVQWDSHGGFVTHFKIIAIMLPRFRTDSEGQSGIVHAATA